MSVKKIAGLFAGFALAVGLIGAGVSASFTDSVTAQQNINVGTFSCGITTASTGATFGAVDALGYAHSVSYTAPTIMSSAPGNAPFSFTVKNTGSIPDVLTVATSAVSAPWSIIGAPFAPVALAAGDSHPYNTGVSWTELGNGNLGASGTVTWTVSCNENGPAVIFDNTPTVLPASLPSYGAQAYSFNEWGGGVTFAGSARKLSTAKVIMNSWACEQGDWTVPEGTSGACVTTPGATYSVPITFNVYNVAASNTVGALITSVTQTFAIPYRPSSIDGGTAWNAAGNHGYNVPITFTFSGQTLPDTAIFGITYKTLSSGYPALGVGSPTDALNIATYPANDVATQAVVGTWLPNDTSSYVGVRGTSTMIGNAPVANMPTGSSDNFVSYMPAVQIVASF
jgi:predicted ribosomally synthesized peptide with SipW-like signal peptide